VARAAVQASHLRAERILISVRDPRSG